MEGRFHVPIASTKSACTFKNVPIGCFASNECRNEELQLAATPHRLESRIGIPADCKNREEVAPHTPEITGTIAFRKEFSNPFDYQYCKGQCFFIVMWIISHRMNGQLPLDFYRLLYYPFLLIFSGWSFKRAFVCYLYIYLASGRADTVRRLLLLKAHATGDHMLMEPCKGSGKQRRLRAFHSGAGKTGQFSSPDCPLPVLDIWPPDKRERGRKMHGRTLRRLRCSLKSYHPTPKPICCRSPAYARIDFKWEASQGNHHPSQLPSLNPDEIPDTDAAVRDTAWIF